MILETLVLAFILVWHEVGNIIMELTPAERRIRRRAYLAAVAIAGGKAVGW